MLFILKLHISLTPRYFLSNRTVGTFQFGKPMLILRDPEVIKQMLVKDFDHFEDHRVLFDDKVCSINSKIQMIFQSNLIPNLR